MLHSAALSTCLHSLASPPPQPPSLAPQPCSTDPPAWLCSPPALLHHLPPQSPFTVPLQSPPAWLHRPPALLHHLAPQPAASHCHFACLPALIDNQDVKIHSLSLCTSWQRGPLPQAGASRAGLGGQLQPCVPCNPRGCVSLASPGGLCPTHPQGVCVPCNPWGCVSHVPPGTLALA